MKYYAVAIGRKTGIFLSWPETEQQVKGFTNASFKSFNTRQEAEAFLLAPSFPRIYGNSGADGFAPPPPKQSAAAAGYLPGTLVVYTDGGAINNPGPGGYGVVIQDRKELSGGFNLTTNNRMELRAVMAAMEALQKEKAPIVLHSDSKYVIDGLNKGWALNWRKKNWIKSDGKPAMNADLWSRLLDLEKCLDIRFKWVKGHAGNPLNERCDELANRTAREKDLPDDTGYLKSIGLSPGEDPGLFSALGTSVTDKKNKPVVTP
ncbi:MAG: ribonuclease HI [Proteobacteria bacterium]|nr:ribonuclease HI [Pseudomonadota bacterium]